ncbi:hypothetical protein MTP04_22780 [Lysinibacillus sp. PLM2]|nr:hypothetical protein MTP04_22780 [Lysinibacillus sp. PLM2]
MERWNSWTSNGLDSVLQCPVPNCGHKGQIITKAHCRLAHEMTRDEVKKKYGMPYRVIVRKRKVEIK